MSTNYMPNTLRLDRYHYKTVPEGGEMFSCCSTRKSRSPMTMSRVRICVSVSRHSTHLLHVRLVPLRLGLCVGGRIGAQVLEPHDVCTHVWRRGALRHIRRCRAQLIAVSDAHRPHIHDDGIQTECKLVEEMVELGGCRVIPAAEWLVAAIAKEVRVGCIVFVDRWSTLANILGYLVQNNGGELALCHEPRKRVANNSAAVGALEHHRGGQRGRVIERPCSF